MSDMGCSVAKGFWPGASAIDPDAVEGLAEFGVGGEQGGWRRRRCACGRRRDRRSGVDAEMGGDVEADWPSESSTPRPVK